MAKRTAGKQLNHDNWDVEEEAEEAGIFVKASDEVLKERKIKVAKRRAVSFQSGGEGGAGAFKGFGGFGAKTASSGLGGFGALTSKPVTSVSNGTTTAPASSSMPDFKFGSKTSAVSNTQKPDSSENSDKSKYYSHMKALNEGVAAWIKKHVDSNPYCILTPIFKDYETHLADIEKLNQDKDNVRTPLAAVKKEEKLDSNVTSSGGFLPTGISSSTTEGAPVFKFSVTSSGTGGPASSSSEDKKEVESSNKISGFNFASSTSSGSTGISGFQFGASSSAGLKPFSFASSSTPADSNGKSAATADDDEYVPPKPEVKEIKEDAVFSKRIKVFYQKDSASGAKEWAEKGVGNLHIKEIDGGKTQLLIRADTNLGNILLNILLSESIPLSRQGKNNVSMICIPSPPIDPKVESNKPVMMLLRVKTAEEADELYEKLTKYKK